MDIINPSSAAISLAEAWTADGAWGTAGRVRQIR